MKTGISLTALAQKIEAQKDLKHDLIVPTEKAAIILDSEQKPQLHIPSQGDFPILPLAHRQIAAHTGIPAQYYDRMQAEAPLLLTKNVNEWFHQKPSNRMVRTLGGDTRAFLSDRYQRIENEEIAEAALPVLADLPGVQIVSCEVTERRLYIHAVVPTVQGEVKVGDVVQAGVIISNSEVGLGSVSISGLIWRLLCLNGMKTQDAYRRNHVGRKVEDNEALWADDTRKADDKAVLLKVRDMVRIAVSETNFRVQLGKMQSLTEGKIVGAPDKAIEVLAKKVGATEGERGGILRSLIEGGDLSRWGILNALTHQAHSTESYDRAVEFEAMGGRLVDLPKNEWKEILEAA
jgi:hypothetical protein